jgi:hypothetical protein
MTISGLKPRFGTVACTIKGKEANARFKEMKENFPDGTSVNSWDMPDGSYLHEIHAGWNAERRIYKALNANGFLNIKFSYGGPPTWHSLW